MHIESDAIRNILPHRDPILLVDSVRIDSPGEAGCATIRLPRATELLAGLQGADLLQELSLEAAAQAFGVVLGSVASPGAKPGKDERHLLIGFTDVTFGPELPNHEDLLQVDVCKAEGAGPTYVGRFTVRSQTVCIASGSVMVMKG